MKAAQQKIIIIVKTRGLYFILFWAVLLLDYNIVLNRELFNDSVLQCKQIRKACPNSFRWHIMTSAEEMSKKCQ